MLTGGLCAFAVAEDKADEPVQAEEPAAAE
jgi:hypothetical protein